MSPSLLLFHAGLAPCRPCQRSVVHYRTVQRERLCPRAQVSLNSSLASTSASPASARQQRTAIVAIDPATTSAPASQTRGGPSYWVIAVACGVVGIFAFVATKLKNKGLDNTSRYSVNIHLASAMKDVNTVRIDDLTPEQIAAARARRSKERANHKLSLEEIDLPQNHPFATKQVLSKEEQEQALQNLRARSMRRRNFDAMQNGGGDDAARTGLGGIGRRR